MWALTRRLLPQLLATAWTVGAAIFLFGFLEARVPFRDAFFWEVAKLVSVAAYLSAAWLCAGAFVLERFRLTRLPPVERFALAGPLGAVVFLAGMWLLGTAHLFGPVAGLGWPLVMVAVGIRSAHRLTKALVARWNQTPLALLELGCFAVGVLMLGLVWLGVLTPDAVNYDAAWNHLVIAQDYAREGGIVGFRADWVKNLPHAGSLINTWAFLVPGVEPGPQRWLLALQLEFFALLWTLVGVCAVASRMLLHRAPRALWTSLALFPGILVYDSNLGGAADHYLALFACAVLLSALRFARRFEPRWAVLSGVLLGTGFATKLQAAFIAVPVLLLFGVALIRRRRAWRPATKGLLLFGAAAFAMVLPHLVRNALVFRNPLYPLAQDLLGGVPTVPEAAQQVQYLFADWTTHPPAPWLRLQLAVPMLATFSFLPHYSFIKHLPTFGFLFTLLTPALLVVRKRGALLPVVLLSYGALFTWAMLVWVDRNLQAFAPWLWAACAGLCVAVWRLGWLARAGLAVLVAVQLAWAAGMYASSNDRIFAGLRLFQGQANPDQAARWSAFHGPHLDAQYLEFDRTLPREAVLLMHNSHIMLGLNRTVLLDWIGFQGLFDYRPMSSVTDLYSALIAERVTHVTWRPRGWPAASKQEEVLFGALSILAAPVTEFRADLALFPLSGLTLPPRPAAPWRVLSLGVANYPDGIYDLPQLGTCERYPQELQHYPTPQSRLPPEGELAPVLSQIQVVVAGDAGKISPALRLAMGADWISTGSGLVHLRRTALGL